MPFICNDGAYNIMGNSTKIFYDISINGGGSITNVEGIEDAKENIIITFNTKGKYVNDIVAKQGKIEEERKILEKGKDYFVTSNTITISKTK